MTDEANMGTITLYDANGVLNKVMEEQEEVSKCNICAGKLEGVCYIICNVERGSANKNHKGHTCCATCKDNETYIGLNGRCQACLNEVGTRRRDMAKAGIALIPPSENKMATELVGIIRKAETEMDRLRDDNEKVVMQEGVNKRALAVEEVKQRKKAREEAEAEIRLMKNNAEKKREQTEIEIQNMKTNAEKEIQTMKTNAEKEIEKTKKNGVVLTEDIVTNKKTRNPMSESSIEKRRKTFETRAKKLAHYDKLLKIRLTLEEHLKSLVSEDEFQKIVSGLEMYEEMEDENGDKCDERDEEVSSDLKSTVEV